MVVNGKWTVSISLFNHSKLFYTSCHHSLIHTLMTGAAIHSASCPPGLTFIPFTHCSHGYGSNVGVKCFAQGHINTLTSRAGVWTGLSTHTQSPTVVLRCMNVNEFWWGGATVYRSSAHHGCVNGWMTTRCVKNKEYKYSLFAIYLSILFDIRWVPRRKGVQLFQKSSKTHVNSLNTRKSNFHLLYIPIQYIYINPWRVYITLITVVSRRILSRA